MNETGWKRGEAGMDPWSEGASIRMQQVGLRIGSHPRAARWRRAPLGVFLALACNPTSAPVSEASSGLGSTGDSSSGPALPSSTTSTSTADTTASPSGPPEVIDIGFDALLLLEGESVVLTAVVVDPDDDVVSGSLYGPGEPSLYGPLTPDLADRWRVEISWDAVHAHAPLNFEGEAQLPFTVRFVDAEGHEAEAETSVRALCGGLRTTACNGACVDPMVHDDHCGGCDQPCTVDSLEGSEPVGGCGGGVCQPHWWECSPLDPMTTCAERCLSQGARCVDGGCNGATVMVYTGAGACGRAMVGVPVEASCRADLSSELPFEPGTVELRCCCV